MKFLETMNGVWINLDHIIAIRHVKSTNIIEIKTTDGNITVYSQEGYIDGRLLDAIMIELICGDTRHHDYNSVMQEAKKYLHDIS